MEPGQCELVRVQPLFRRTTGGAAGLPLDQVRPLVAGQTRSRYAIDEPGNRSGEDRERGSGRRLGDGADFPAAEHMLFESGAISQLGENEHQARVEDVRPIGGRMSLVQASILEHADAGAADPVLTAGERDVAGGPRERVRRLELRAMAEAAHQLRLQRVIQRAAGVI